MLDMPGGADDDEVANCSSDDDLSNVDETCIGTAAMVTKTTTNPPAKDDDESSDGDIDEGLDNVAPEITQVKNQEMKRPSNYSSSTKQTFSINLAKATAIRETEEKKDLPSVEYRRNKHHSVANETENQIQKLLEVQR